MGCCGSTRHYGEVSIDLPDGIEQLTGLKPQKLKQLVKDNGALMDVVSRSFCGTAETLPEGTMDWLLGPKLKEKWEDPRRKVFMDWMCKMILCSVHLQGGFTLGARNSTGNLSAVAMIIPCLKGFKDVSNCQFMTTLLPVIGTPPEKEMGDAAKGIMKRIDSFSLLVQKHKKHVPGAHLYVQVMAVEPNSQGMGFCGKLMRLINMVADAQCLPLYLETSGERNVAIYEHFGYKIVDKFMLSCPKDPDKAEADSEFAMLRHAKATE